MIILGLILLIIGFVAKIAILWTIGIIVLAILGEAYLYKRRLHAITLFVFRADGLPWGAADLRPVGRSRGTLATSRGFHVLLWREGDLGYALVSDVAEQDLLTLGAKIAGG